MIAGPVLVFPLSLMVTGPVRPLKGISKYEIGCPPSVVKVWTLPPISTVTDFWLLVAAMMEMTSRAPLAAELEPP